ncbi:hypothetical protein ONS95_012573 [Cadophora gregata]|uniref:uncharacterized protein n=1 Tax=Cadophora gregata TaxID=51156 RepID=UPI0026DBFF06|nr:uncharacterized protein ONS95_012573 [Cadophora gregata]KAK0118274.1 hypothetical protein ONS95_012573 [Cadophora gregata]KAK0123345.1 hypothetical protein ONS96_010338 [Cadophora gregata f. sp. sojae]
MESLPNELRRVILQHLPISDLKSIRRASKSWSILGQEYLLAPIFRTLPHRPDTLHLKGISTHPAFNHRIQSIHFNHGEVNEYSGRHNSYFLQYLMVPEERLTQQYAAWKAYEHFKQLTNTYLPTSCDEDMLTEIFANLPNLTSLKISLMLCPFIKWDPEVPELLVNIWGFPSTRLLPRVATVERMTSIMNAIAANSATLTINSLSHDRLPFEFFFQNQKKMAVISTSFRNLTTLELLIEYSDLPNDTHAAQAFSNLRKCLRAAPLLKDLSLGFQGRRKVDIAPLLASFAADEYTFLHLSTLQLQGMITTETDLCDFLVRQKSTLTRVILGGPGVVAVRQPANGGIFLDTGSWKGLVSRLSEELKLDKAGACVVLLQGDLKGLESGERWVFEKAVAAREAMGEERHEEEVGVGEDELIIMDESDAPWPV